MFSGSNMGLHRVMHRFFTRLFARPATVDDVKAIFALMEHRMDAMEAAQRDLETRVHHCDLRSKEAAAEIERVESALDTFRGRVYAWKRWTPPEEEQPPAGTQAPQELPLTDPRVSKAELRARLIKPGRPFPHKP